MALMEGELLTVAEVAARLKANPNTIRRWLREGRLKGVQLGGDRFGWRISEVELRRFIESGGQSAASEQEPAEG